MDKAKRYLFEYRHDGAVWGIEVFASSPDDARARIRSLYHNGELQGEIALTVKAPLWIGRIASLWRAGE